MKAPSVGSFTPRTAKQKHILTGRGLKALPLGLLVLASSVAACGGGDRPYDSIGAGGKKAGVGGSSSASAGGAPSSGGAVEPIGSTDCAVVPINPNATPQARKLLCFFYSVYGQYVVSGQQETSWSKDPAGDVSWIRSQTGKYPAILGGDYLYPDGTTDRAKAWWLAGGITMIRYHMGAPPLQDSYENSKGVSDIAAVLTAGTAENSAFVSKLDYAAGELKILQEANVAVLWAPFHEAQPNGWFWWSRGTGEQLVALWRYTYDYLTNTKGLNNLVWLMPFSGNPVSEFYPGRQYVDLAGPDTYTKSQPFAGIFANTVGVVGEEIPIPLHETGVIPDPEAMFAQGAPWVLFNVWAGFQSDTKYNTIAGIQAAYASPRTITRDELPDLK